MALTFLKIVEYSVTFIALYVTVFFLLLFVKNFQELKKPVKLNKGWIPKISVIIPAYNEQQTIVACVNSVLEADYPQEALEIIVVDDGSEDGTFKLASSIGDGRIKVLRKPNSGKASALNHGIAHAKGELIATLDADSYLEKDSIWKLLALFDSDDVAAVTAAVKVRYSEKEGMLESIQRVEYLFTIFSRRVLSFIDAVPVTPGPFSIFRSWVFSRFGGFDEKSILEDQEIALRIQQHNYLIRSSLDAEVFTEIPKNFPDLLNQRIRWHRGGLHNTVKYLRLISPHYGDFGLIIMPLTLLAIAAIIGIIFVVMGSYLSGLFYYPNLGISSLSLGVGAAQVIGLFIILLNLVWIGCGMLFFRKEKVGFLRLLLYIIAHSYLMTLYWIAALVKELTFRKLSW